MKSLIQQARFLQTLGLSELVLSAGMQRSGSTLMFNMIRLLIISDGARSLSAGYVKDFDRLERGDIYLIKMHGLPRLSRWRASTIFYTYRDVRTAMVSQLRKFHDTPSISFAERSIREYESARKAGALMIRYEDLVSRPGEQIERIARRLSLNADIEAVRRELESLEQPAPGSGYSRETLLHPSHKTATRDDDWRHVLDAGLSSNINDRFGWWLRSCGYAES